jgi:hypothetical protein
LHFPGTREQAFAFAKQNNIGDNWADRDYDIWDLGREYGKPVILGIQRVPPPVLSPQHVQGGQPTGVPVGQPNRNAPAGERDPLGFEPIADANLSGSAGGMFQERSDFEGTVTDMIDGGRIEVQRPK